MNVKGTNLIRATNTSVSSSLVLKMWREQVNTWWEQPRSVVHQALVWKICRIRGWWEQSRSVVHQGLVWKTWRIQAWWEQLRSVVYQGCVWKMWKTWLKGATQMCFFTKVWFEKCVGYVPDGSNPDVLFTKVWFGKHCAPDRIEPKLCCSPRFGWKTWRIRYMPNGSQPELCCSPRFGLENMKDTCLIGGSQICCSPRFGLENV